MRSINVSDEVHERIRIRAHRSGRSVKHVADVLLTDALDRFDEAITEVRRDDATLDQVAAISRESGPEAGLQALLFAAGAEIKH